MVSRPSGPDRAAWQTSVCADIIRPSGHVQEFVGILTWGIAAVGGMVVALEWYSGWCYFADVVRQYGAVSRQVLITFFECVVQYRAQGPVGRVFVLGH